MNGGEEKEKIYSVTEITETIKRKIVSIGPIRVEGEIFQLSLAHSGNTYFSLKDSGALLNVILFRGEREGLPPGLELREGIKVRIRGQLDLYRQQGRYNLIAREIEEVSKKGELLKRFEALKAKLQEEGLFDRERKRELPKLPRRIAILTSPTGSVLHDMITVLTRRFPNLEIRIVPIPVQGEGAAPRIANAIRSINRIWSPESASPVDLMIVGRGGGSLEDLWPFNEEVLVRAVAESTLPLISAVGHETDFTLCDFAADLRAPTPSAAAELAVPEKRVLLEEIVQLKRRVINVAEGYLKGRRQEVKLLSATLSNSPQHSLEHASQHLDTLDMRLAHALERRRSEARRQFDNLDMRLAHALERRRTEARSQFEHLEHRFTLLKGQSTARIRERIGECRTALLQALPRSLAGARQRLALSRTSLLLHQRHQVEMIRKRLEEEKRALLCASERRRHDAEKRVGELARQLHLLNPLAVLARGYTLTRTAEGRLVKSIADLKAGTELATQVKDGVIHSTVKEIRSHGSQNR